MATKFVLRSHSLPFAIFSANRLTRKPLLHNFSLLQSSPFSPFSTTISSTLTLNPDFVYGPSLHKGNKPSHSQQQQQQQQQQQPHEISKSSLQKLNDEDEEEEEEEEVSVIDEESFSRVFDVAAIRVPSEDCFALENRLRGHLLNWPRVRNIARVSGDEMEDEFKNILATKSDKDEENLDSLNRRLYGRAEGDGERLDPVLYRDNLAKSFDSRGFMKFKNLAKISRPKRKKKKKGKEQERGFEGRKRIGKNDFVVVEVVEDREDDEEGDLSGLLGDEFKAGRWKGSTRLLLLDERFANSTVEELPEAVKVPFSTL